jgi:hypothetical protein
MAVIPGEAATIGFGVADAPDWAPGKYAAGERGTAGEKGGIKVQMRLGDVFLMPAGVAHKTFLPTPRLGELAFYQPRDIAEGRAGERGEEVERKRRRFFEGVGVQGEFMMMGRIRWGRCGILGLVGRIRGRSFGGCVFLRGIWCWRVVSRGWWGCGGRRECGCCK